MIRSPRPFLTTAVLSLFMAGPCAAIADVKMPAIFGDHMVLQQDLQDPVWGTAAPGEVVKVTVGAQTAAATAGADGRWKLKLAPLSLLTLGAPALTMTVAGRNILTFHDVVIGEVWVCSGQSNMEYGLGSAHDAATSLPKANDPGLRLFHVARNTAHLPAADVAGKWEICTPATAGPFTAVGYYFGRELRAKLNRPVGLIESCWGGTPAEAWTSLDGLGKDPALAHYIEQWKTIDAAYPAALLRYPLAMIAFKAALADWNANYAKALAAANAKWKLDAAQAAAAMQSPPPRPVAPVPMPRPPPDPAGGQSAPGALYNAMIAPLQPFAVRGVIWYQGEQNTGRAQEYGTLFPRLIRDWREKWGEGDFPFLFVQLAGYGRDDKGWPALRAAQAATLSLPNTAMATAVDIGVPDNIHPMDKLDVGLRLALAARRVAYGEKDLVDSGPVLKSVARAGAGLKVAFTDTGSGLIIGQAPWVGPKVTPLPTDRLVGFELAGADGKWLPANAKIDGQSVIVSNPAVPSPASVRYDWKASPQGNLYNKEGLPAPPFQATPK